MKQAKKVCMFCPEPIMRGGREVALYSPYGPVRQGMAHDGCLKRYLNSVERGKLRLAPWASNERSLIELAEETQARIRENSRNEALERMFAKRK